MKKAPAGITGSFSMLFLMVLGRFPEKLALAYFDPFNMITGLILFAYLELVPAWRHFSDTNVIELYDMSICLVLFYEKSVC